VAGPSSLTPDRISWGELEQLFYSEHRQGEHLTVVGPTDSGKTVLLRELAKIRARRRADDGNPSRVAYLATKPKSRSVSELGWPVAKRWPPGYGQWHVVVWPRFPDPETAASRQAVVFRRLLKTIYAEGGQTVVVDELTDFTEPQPEGMGLKSIVVQYETKGRELDLSLFAATQRPVNVPRVVWSEPKWFGVFRIEDYDDLRRVREIAGRGDHFDELIQTLDDHEFAFVHRRGSRRDYFVSKVAL
jgi:energy-coupling factor transporter ATP-binding protein EcfA2